MNIAHRIQSLRKAKGISQEELADKVGVSRQAVSKWESEQSTPDMDNIIIMSDYFEVTTDYLLKGTETVKTESEKSGSVLASQILYISSTALVLIGLLCAFANWYEQQKAEDIWGAMIIQVVGLAAYFIGGKLSDVKPPFWVLYLNIVIFIFIPISMLSGVLSVPFFKEWWIAPYPTDKRQLILFAVIYLGLSALSFFLLRKRKK